MVPVFFFTLGTRWTYASSYSKYPNGRDKMRVWGFHYTSRKPAGTWSMVLSS